MWQQLTKACWILLISLKLVVPHRVTHPILYPPGVLELATSFHVADKNEAIQGAMDTGLLWHHPRPLSAGFEIGTPAETGGSRLAWDDGQWFQSFHMYKASFIDMLSPVPGLRVLSDNWVCGDANWGSASCAHSCNCFIHCPTLPTL